MALIYEIIDTQRLRQKAPSNWKRIVNISLQNSTPGELIEKFIKSDAYIYSNKKNLTCKIIEKIFENFELQRTLNNRKNFWIQNRIDRYGKDCFMQKKEIENTDTDSPAIIEINKEIKKVEEQNEKISQENTEIGMKRGVESTIGIETINNIDNDTDNNIIEEIKQEEIKEDIKEETTNVVEDKENIQIESTDQSQVDEQMVEIPTVDSQSDTKVEEIITDNEIISNSENQIINNTDEKYIKEHTEEQVIEETSELKDIEMTSYDIEDDFEDDANKYIFKGIEYSSLETLCEEINKTTEIDINTLNHIINEKPSKAEKKKYNEIIKNVVMK